ncbi:hypothetical protein [Microbacterium marinilacus]|uniref:HNH endonuclease n=1 Tax=Microbacterium marinilacus TaxID=415209 RepID=A0ABP7BTC7_9MICO|nr:hypothetical protein [Microbacterium marinilacus]MBY0689156.1 hypothetical protein [Microbacterium marinilacus]
MEVNGSGFPADAAARLEAARAELEAARAELAALVDAVSWAAPVAVAFREAAGARMCDTAAIAATADEVLSALHRQGGLLAVDGR